MPPALTRRGAIIGRMVEAKIPRTYLSKNGGKFRVINHGVPISPDKDTAEAALAVAKQFRMSVSERVYDGDADAWVQSGDDHVVVPILTDRLTYDRVATSNIFAKCPTGKHVHVGGMGAMGVGRALGMATEEYRASPGWGELPIEECYDYGAMDACLAVKP